MMRTPDQRLRVFVSSTLQELAAERAAARTAIGSLRLTPVLFELGARPHPPRSLYRAYLEQSQIFIGLYWQRYGWVAPGMDISGLEDEYRLSGSRPKLIYLKIPAPELEAGLRRLLDQIQADDQVSYKSFSTPEELQSLIENDLALLLTERFELTRAPEAPPTSVQPSHSTNLPAHPPRLIGRDQDAATLRQLLLEADRGLLTLTGTGGCGKTSLALEVARALVGEFPDGVRLAELAPLSDPTLVPGAVAAALDVREGADRPLLATLERFLQPRRVLLVLDNCEHLVDACARLADALLRACPALRILATSREALRIPGEITWRVPSLDVPDARRLPPLEELTACASVRLFVERARAGQSRFRLTADNALSVAQICARLDGIPLALELAAARVQGMPIETLAERLQDSFRLLSGGSRTAPTRQQTITAALDWSHALLAEAERVLLRRLAVFAGGFDLHAAEAVCAGDGVERVNVLDLLAQLVDRSLIEVVEQQGAGRYRVLEPIRQYAHEQLGASGEKDAIERAHETYYLALAERIREQLFGEWVGPLGTPEQVALLARLEREHDNLRAVLQRAQARGDADLLVRLGAALGPFWTFQLHLREAMRWVAEAVKPGRTPPTRARAGALAWAGTIAWALGDTRQAAALCREAADVAEAVGDRDHLAGALHMLGVATGYAGDPAGGRRHLERSIALYGALDNSYGRGLGLFMLGKMLRHQGDAQEAPALIEEGCRLVRAAGDLWQTAEALGDLASLARERGAWDDAEALATESLLLVRRLGLRYYVAENLGPLAGVALARGAPGRAARLLGAASAMRETTGMALFPGEQAAQDHIAVAARAALGEAVFTAAWGVGRGYSVDQAIEDALAGEP